MGLETEINLLSLLFIFSHYCLVWCWLRENDKNRVRCLSFLAEKEVCGCGGAPLPPQPGVLVAGEMVAGHAVEPFFKGRALTAALKDD